MSRTTQDLRPVCAACVRAFDIPKSCQCTLPKFPCESAVNRQRPRILVLVDLRSRVAARTELAAPFNRAGSQIQPRRKAVKVSSFADTVTVVLTRAEARVFLDELLDVPRGSESRN